MPVQKTKGAEAVRPSGAAGTDAVIARSGRVRLDSPEGARVGTPALRHKAFDYRAIKGVLPTVLTPYDEHEQVDAAALEEQVKYLLDSKVHGLVLMGSFGESPYLNDADREIIIRTVAETAAGVVPIVVGITAHSTFVAAEQVRQAQRLGASAVMVCLPQYFKLKFADVKRHFARLSEMSLLPIFYYHYPAASGLDLKSDQVAELMSLPNIAGIKESTFDMLAVKRHITLTRELDRVYLSGSELNFFQFMDLGGHGVVGAGSLIMPRTAVAMYESYEAGERIRARELQSLMFETMPLTKRITAPVGLVRKAFLVALHQGLDVPLDAEPTQVRLKAALARRGIPIKPIMRSPLPPPTPQDEQAVEQAMTRIKQIEP